MLYNKTDEIFIHDLVKFLKNYEHLNSKTRKKFNISLEDLDFDFKLIIKPKIIKEEKYDVFVNKEGVVKIDMENRENESISTCSEEINKKEKGKGSKAIIDSNKQIEGLLENKPLCQQEESKKENYFPNKSKSSQKFNLKYGKKLEHIKIESTKSKESYEKYSCPLDTIKEQKEIKPKGLFNLGLNCYMNSLLQCLFHIKDLRNYFIENKELFTDKQPVCKAFAEVMYGLKNDENDYYEPKSFKKIMGNVLGLFKGIKAGDAKDLFFHLIDSFLTELAKEVDNVGSDSDNVNNICFDKEKAFQHTLKWIDKDNIIYKTFIGFYESIYNCNIYTNIYSFQEDSFLLFELEKIKKYFKNDKLSLELCFNYYYREQKNSEFYCNRCSRKQIGKAYEKIYRPPKILVLILDRGHGKTFTEEIEIDKYIDLKNIIDDKNYINSSIYRLICIATHQGSSSPTGHYTACCLADDNKYYYFDDTYVHEIKEENLFNNEPYLLFYERIDINKLDEVEKIKKEIKVIKIEEEQSKYNYLTTKDNSPNYSQKTKERLERLEEERLEKEKREKEKLEGLEKERLEKERLEKERREKERLERERREKERLEKERLEKERREKERLEKEKQERQEKERQEKERKEKLKERIEKEKQERLERERERQEKEIERLNNLEALKQRLMMEERENNINQAQYEFLGNKRQMATKEIEIYQKRFIRYKIPKEKENNNIRMVKGELNQMNNPSKQYNNYRPRKIIKEN